MWIGLRSLHVATNGSESDHDVLLIHTTAMSCWCSFNRRSITKHDNMSWPVVQQSLTRGC